MNNLIDKISKEPNADPFLEPVDWKGLALNDYPKIIKKPMDLGTIRKKVDSKTYTTFDQFFADIQLIWDNCKLYNIAESEIYRMAEELERSTKRMILKMKSSLGLTGTNKKSSKEDEGGKSEDDEDEDEEGEVSFDERIRFTDNIRKLTIEQMTKLVKMIQED
jgi:hypothetical protein